MPQPPQFASSRALSTQVPLHSVMHALEHAVPLQVGLRRSAGAAHTVHAEPHADGASSGVQLLEHSRKPLLHVAEQLPLVQAGEPFGLLGQDAQFGPHFVASVSLAHSMVGYVQRCVPVLHAYSHCPLVHDGVPLLGVAQAVQVLPHCVVLLSLTHTLPHRW